jgi:SnoaL-like domain
MSQENVELYRRGIEAFNRRDLEAFLALADLEVVGISRVLAVERPSYRGHDGTREWWKDLLDVFPDFMIEVVWVRDADDLTVSELRCSASEVSAAPLEEFVCRSLHPAVRAAHRSAGRPSPSPRDTAWAMSLENVEIAAQPLRRSPAATSLGGEPQVHRGEGPRCARSAVPGASRSSSRSQRSVTLAIAHSLPARQSQALGNGAAALSGSSAQHLLRRALAQLLHDNSFPFDYRLDPITST